MRDTALLPVTLVFPLEANLSGSPLKHAAAQRFEVLVEPENEAQTMECVVERIGRGMTYQQVCDELRQPYSKMLVWLQGSEERWGQFRKAYEARSWNLVDEALQIADDSSGDVTTNKRGEEVIDTEAIQRAKLRVDTRFRYAKHHAPEVFGDRVAVQAAAGGADAGFLLSMGELLGRVSERARMERPAIPAERDVTPPKSEQEPNE